MFHSILGGGLKGVGLLFHVACDRWMQQLFSK